MNNPYILQPIRIVKIEQLNTEVKLLTLDYAFPKYNPGQFFMLNLPGIGEAAFGIMQPICDKNFMEVLVRKVGDFTTKLHELKKDDKIYLRGPFGNGFPVNEWEGKNITMIVGGTGIVPIKALLDYISLHRKYFGDIQLLYGAKTAEEILFNKELNRCQKFAEVMLTVEKDKSWQGNIGLVTNLITPKTVMPDNSVAVLCGPPIMYKFVIEKLKKLGFTNKDIFVSLERRMRC